MIELAPRYPKSSCSKARNRYFLFPRAEFATIKSKPSKFECLKDKTSLTDSLSGGDPAKVNFDIRGIEYYGKYYVNLNAWRIEKSGGGGAPPAEEGFASESPPSHLSEPPAGHGNESDDDIPF